MTHSRDGTQKHELRFVVCLLFSVLTSALRPGLRTIPGTKNVKKYVRGLAIHLKILSAHGFQTKRSS